MTAIEISAVVIIGIQFLIIYWLANYNKDLIGTKDKLVEMCSDAELKSLALEKQLKEADKKAKLSNNVIAILNDISNGGAILEVNRIDRNEIFFHTGGLK